VDAGQVIFLFPGVWHRYRPDEKTGWDEHWVGFDGDVARRWVRNNFFRRARRYSNRNARKNG
jgi:AraC-like ligand binding domain